MPGGGTRTFLEPDHYEAGLRQAQIGAVILPRDNKFSARLTWAELHHLQLLRCEEDHPGTAYVQLAPELAFMSPSEYVPLRRLEEVRRVLRDANPKTVNIAEVAHRFGFAEAGCFAETYRARFGEAPSATLQRIPENTIRSVVNFPNFCIGGEEPGGLASANRER